MGPAVLRMNEICRLIVGPGVCFKSTEEREAASAHHNNSSNNQEQHHHHHHHQQKQDTPFHFTWAQGIHLQLALDLFECL
jgi:hypothetical protein